MWQILFITISIQFVVGQTPGVGPCPKVETVKSFDANKYLGKWYEIQRSVPNWFEVSGKCVTANYSSLPGGKIKVVNLQLSKFTGVRQSIVGEAFPNAKACQNSTQCAKLTVKFPIPIVGNVDGNYWVLDTDYTNYSVVYSCSDYVAFHAKMVWLLARTPKPDASISKKLSNIPAISDVFMSETDQAHCP